MVRLQPGAEAWFHTLGWPDRRWRGRVRQILPTPETLNNNLELLRVDPARLDALVLSHGHYDHFGGMVGFLKANQGRLTPSRGLKVGQSLILPTITVQPQ